jgi:hypothetical protein
MRIDKALAGLVRDRAKNQCEYCQLPQQFTSIPFEVDHIVADQHQGKAVLKNLAWACFADNRHKGPNLSGIDPKTRKRTWLYNPRSQKWDRHFRWNGQELVGRTGPEKGTP